MSKRPVVSISDSSDDESAVSQHSVTATQSFRINGRHIALTYAQVPEEWTREWLLEQLRKRGTAFDSYVVAMERHEDGGKHFHVYLRAVNKFDIKNARYYDIGDRHPNIQVCKNHTDWIKYCLKEDSEALKEGVKEGRPTYGDVFAAENITAAISMVQTYWPRDLAINGDRIRSNLELHFRERESANTVPRTRYTLDSFKSVGAAAVIREWFRAHVLERPMGADRSPCLIVIGPTRLAKTSFIRAFHEQHMYFRGQFALDGWIPNAKYIVFDDIEWKFIPHKKELLTNMDQELWLTDKYRGKKSVRTTMPSVILWNKDYLHDDVTEDHAYWDANVQIVEVSSKLYL